MRVIDAEELEARLRMQPNNLSTISVIDMVHASPTVEKRKKGHWINLTDDREGYGDIVESICSVCEMNGNYKWKACPYCTAIMEGSETDAKEL